MYDHKFSTLANHETKHQATHKVGCQPGDCTWSLQSSSGVCVGMYGLTYSLYHPRADTHQEVGQHTDVNFTVCMAQSNMSHEINQRIKSMWHLKTGGLLTQELSVQ